MEPWIRRGHMQHMQHMQHSPTCCHSLLFPCCTSPACAQVRFAILDEADQMLDMGFEEDMEKILSNVPAEVRAPARQQG